MLNYGNLNDMEFEALCQDIMSRKLGIPLRRFAPGRDGGVDLTDDAAERNIVVQVKHYTSSTTAALIRVLKSELEKVERLEPEQYYICCSKQLSPDNLRELYEYFQDYMDSSANIVTLTEIDDFLKDPENRDILKKHFKLWLDDTGILEDLYNDEIFVDCEVLLADVEARQQYFVRTSAFDKALKILDKGQVLCIIGDPGVGKSMTSQMLVLHYAALGYRVRYTTEVTDLKSLKKSLQQDKDAKEIILLDDCFGQAYFEMKASQSKELVTLIRYVRLHPGKLLILNSRITIYQEAKARQRDLKNSLDMEDFQVQVLDMSGITPEEKARILYNHLYFSGIPAAYFDQIRQYCHYRGIIFHPNYNPRIIEYVCRRYRKVEADRFFEFVMGHLDNPREIWADEYEDRLQLPDRILLQTIYSMTNTSVSARLVEKCYNRRLKRMPDIDDTVDQYARSLERLNENFVKLLDDDGTQLISMLNPSVNDFLDNRLQPGRLEYETLLESICCEKQLLYLLPEKEQLPFAVELLRSGRINDFIFEEPCHRIRFIARCILASGLCMEQYRSELHTFLIDPKNIFWSKSLWFGMDRIENFTVIPNLKDPKLWECYQLKEFFGQDNHLRAFIDHFYLEQMMSAVSAIAPFYQDAEDNAYFIQQVDPVLCQEIENYSYAEASEYADEYEFPEDWPEDDLISDLESFVHDQIADRLTDALALLPDCLSYLQGEEYLDQIEVGDAASAVAIHFERLDEETEDEEEEYDDTPALMDPIDAIFQR